MYDTDKKCYKIDIQLQSDNEKKKCNPIYRLVRLSFGGFSSELNKLSF